MSTPWFWGQEIHQDQLDYHLAIRQSKIHHGVQNGHQMGKLAAKCISTPKIEGNYFIPYISSMTKSHKLIILSILCVSKHGFQDGTSALEVL